MKIKVVQYFSLFLILFFPSISGAATDSLGDPFEDGKLQNPNWKWQNEPPNWNVTASLFMDCEPNRNLWVSDATHLLYQEIDTEMFDVETQFRAIWGPHHRWGGGTALMGLVVKSPADADWVTLKFWARQASDIKGAIMLQSRMRDIASKWIPRQNAVLFQGVPAGTQEVDLHFRLKKEGDIYTAWYKTTKTEDWILVGVTDFKLTPPLQLGIYGGVQSNGILQVEYEYFKDNLNPFPMVPKINFDLNGDGAVNILDLVIVANAIGETDSEADVNGDGAVNILDLVHVANQI
ncbi:MAG: dockerin type I domain-containing protein [Candidatus Poribacteria bacterium]|nr:dockerin type I domain-containing protein [Candidatus Poribacteria bacterium]